MPVAHLAAVGKTEALHTLRVARLELLWFCCCFFGVIFQKMVETAVLKGGRPLKVPKQRCLNKIR